MTDYKSLISEIDNYLYNYFTPIDEYQKKVYDSMLYSLSSGGKRIRPLLCLLTYNAITGSEDYSKILPFAAAIECIHTYSLIHDDLPAMDNDDFRRGKPTNHKVYSEVIAILAGDGLLNMAAEILSKEIEKYDNLEEMKRTLKAMKYIFNSSGANGMIGGQVIDMEYSSIMNLDMCETMYKLKTAALIKASMVSAAIVAGVEDNEVTIFETIANNIGVAYQIEDDILDEDSDADKEKNTMTKFKNVDELKEEIVRLTDTAENYLDEFNYNTEDLKKFIRALINRGN